MNQPKVFVGTHQEFTRLCRENNWHPRKTIILSSVDTSKIRGMILNDSDIYRGVTRNELPLRVRIQIDEELRIATLRYGDEK